MYLSNSIKHSKIIVEFLASGLICALLIFLLFAYPSSILAQNQPDLVSISVSTVFNDVENEIVLYGTDFEDLPVVLVGSETLTNVTWINTNEVRVFLPQGFTAGLYTLTLTNPGGASDSLVDALTVYNPGPQPELTSINPMIIVNEFDQTIVLTGSGFHQWTQVIIGDDVMVNLTLISDTEINVLLPAGHSVGIFDVTVVNPGDMRITLPGVLTIQNPEPTITTVTPDSALNDANTRLSITGSHFMSTSSVQLGNTALTDLIFTSDTNLEALLPWGMDAGIYNLVVTNPGPGNPQATLIDAVSVSSAFGVWNNHGPYGGSAKLIVVHPDDENIVFASMSGVGLFRSADGGLNWQKVFQKDPFQIAIAPSDHNIVYAAWAILQKSADKGITWNFVYNDANPFSLGEASAFLIHPSNANVLFAGIPNLNTVNSGFFRSSDGGYTWQRKEVGMTHNSIAGAVFHPDDPNRIFAVTSDGYIYESIDGAEHWQEHGHPKEAFSGLSIDPFGDHDLWAGYCPFPIDQSDYNGIAVATLNNPGTWTDISTFRATGWCSPTVTVFDPVNSGTIFVSAYTQGHKTTDGGQSWQSGLAGGIQLLNFGLSAANPDTIYASHWGKGIKKSLDGGQTWETVNQGLAAVVPWSLAVAADNLDEVYFGSNPYGIYWSESGGQTWLEQSPSMGSNSLASDPFVSGRVYSTAFNGMNISSDHAKTWAVSPFNPPVPAWCTSCIGGSQTFGIGVDPNTPGKILASIAFEYNPPDTNGWPGGIAISYDYGATFTLVEPDVPRGSMEIFLFPKTDPDIIYASGWNGIYRSSNGGLNWENITPPESLNTRFTSFAIHPDNPQLIFSCFDDGTSYGIWRSYNGGLDWEKGAAGIMGWRLEYADSFPQVLYMGSPDGLYASYDNGSTLIRAAGSLGYANVTRLAFAQDPGRYVLYVGTAGGISEPASGSAVKSIDVGANAGLYRKTQIALNNHIFLPMIHR